MTRNPVPTLSDLSRSRACANRMRATSKRPSVRLQMRGGRVPARKVTDAVSDGGPPPHNHAAPAVPVWDSSTKNIGQRTQNCPHCRRRLDRDGAVLIAGGFQPRQPDRRTTVLPVPGAPVRSSNCRQQNQ